MSDECLLCPYCGCKYSSVLATSTKFHVDCNRCHSTGEAKWTKAKAIAAWNRRHVDAENKRLREENQSFGNVLAMIHRDGGHYISKYGHKKASRDAIQLLIVDRNRICSSCGKAVSYEHGAEIESGA